MNAFCGIYYIERLRERDPYCCVVGNRSTTVESHCLQNGSWTPVELNCVPNEELLALDPRRGGKSSDDFLVSLTSSNVNNTSPVNTPTLLLFVVIITVILGMAITSIVFLIKKWYQKLVDYSPQHFILSTQHQLPKFKDLDANGQPTAEANNYATMPVSYKAHNEAPDHFHTIGKKP